MICTLFQTPKGQKTWLILINNIISQTSTKFNHNSYHCKTYKPTYTYLFIYILCIYQFIYYLLAINNQNNPRNTALAQLENRKDPE